eukprot:CAMPEP_0119008858 /NCGR_PEP_ID=MMETSP1176-20130426/3989_1 /TAXON_ID=265551 /ORGANISM="Synedropsis recta cf, Strain CCMP1620" /LENGTH=210 /DNA_ID=CAMNT_0006961267 /DNA_START=82 /DNA_END=714 /DNA_ORIENTATION=-
MSSLARHSSRPLDGGGRGGDLSVPVAVVSAVVAAGISYVFGRRRRRRSSADVELDRILDMLNEDGSQQKYSSLSHQNALKTTAETPRTPPELSSTVGGSSLSSNDCQKVGADEQESIASSEEQRQLELDNLSIAENSRGEKEIYILPTSEAPASPRSIGGSVSSLSVRRERAREKEGHMRLLLRRAHSKIQLEDIGTEDIGEVIENKTSL